MVFKTDANQTLLLDENLLSVNIAEFWNYMNRLTEFIDGSQSCPYPYSEISSLKQYLYNFQLSKKKFL